MSNRDFQEFLRNSGYTSESNGFWKTLIRIINMLFNGAFYTNTEENLIANLLDPSNIVIDFRIPDQSVSFEDQNEVEHLVRQ